MGNPRNFSQIELAILIPGEFDPGDTDLGDPDTGNPDPGMWQDSNPPLPGNLDSGNPVSRNQLRI